jgi:hypothetical protein
MPRAGVGVTLRGMRVSWAPCAAALPLAIACTSLLGIDETYTLAELADDAGAGAPPLGAGSAPADPSEDATPNGAGASSAVVAPTARHDGGSHPDRVADAPPCPEGQKRCPLPERGLACVAPDPSVGCGGTGCDSCPNAPPGGFSVCIGDQCGFECLAGYVRQGESCEPVASSDAGTGGGSGGIGVGGQCTAHEDCRECSPVIAGCCTPLSRQCGCLYVAWCQPLF